MAVNTQSLDLGAKTVSRRWFLYILVLAGIGLLAFFLLYRLGEYPVPWYDEGSHLHVAKNYGLNGIYADFSSEGLRFYGPAVGVGPTVMLPVALLFRISGVSIVTARLIIVTYSVLALIALVAVGRSLGGMAMGLVTAVLLVLAPGAEYIMNSRTVLGEIPGLFFLLAGLWLWIRQEKTNLLALIGTGILIGLACITKNQYAIFILPSLLLCWIADLIWYRQRGVLHFVIPGIVAGLIFFGWTFIVLVALGGGNFSENMATLRTASSGAFFIFGMAEMEKAVRLLVNSSVYGGLFIPALLYGIYLGVQRTREGQRWGTLAIFTLTSSALFVSSLAWTRYAFPAIAISSLLVARLLYDLTGGFRLNNMRREDSSLIHASRVLVAGLLVILVALPIFNHFNHVRREGNSDVYVLADYLDANVPKDVVIETWEQELGVVTNHKYHYPPQVVLAYSVDETWRGGTPAHELYDFRDAADAEYVIVGEFAKYTNIYPLERLEDYRLIHTQGKYDVYQLQP